MGATLLSTKLRVEELNSLDRYAAWSGETESGEVLVHSSVSRLPGRGTSGAQGK